VLEGANGAVGMIGFSYQGSTQLLAASEALPELKAIAPAMFGWDIYRGWAFENGAFRLAGNLTWATQVAAETARRRGDVDAYAELYRTSRAVPLLEGIAGKPAFVDRHDGLGHYKAWLEEPATSSYWADRSPSARLEELKKSCPPALIIGGWYDNQLPGVLDAYHELTTAGRETRLVIGPWAHFTWDQKVGDVDFGPEAINRTGLLLLRWFNHWLKGEGDLSDLPQMSVFDMGNKTWINLEDWPIDRKTFYLSGDGSASVDSTVGGLVESVTQSGTIEWMVTDPWRPAPAHGGALVTPAGPIDRSRVDGRPDVLTFTTQPLITTLRLCGKLAVALSLVSEAASFDVAVTLSRVSTDGRVFALGEGYCTLNASAEVTELELALRATCISIAPEERLRISIAGACFPTYAVNPGTGERAECARMGDAGIIATGIRVNGPSSVTLTILN